MLDIGQAGGGFCEAVDDDDDDVPKYYPRISGAAGYAAFALP